MNGYSSQRGGSRRGGGGGGHQPASSQGGSRAELSSAYASLAAELTRKEIKTVGGYALGRVIGEGTFGKVRIATHRLTNSRVAVKQVPKSLPFSSDAASPLSLLTRELHHHRRLRHPHILALYEIIATESSIYLVSELCTGGELFDYLVEKGRLSLGETRRIFGQLVLGVAHLHQNGVVHRDLKLENVLLDERVNVKIADLGFGREFEKGRWMETWVGTLGYCAPEVVAAKRYLGEEVDIWSLGVILYTLLAGSLPFDDDDEGIMKDMILKCEYDIPTWLDEDAADLIKNILVLDPLRRLPLKSILAHPFFTRDPPPQESHLFRRDASPHMLPEAFPPVIFEESSLSELPPLDDPAHPLHASDVSDSYFSASGSSLDGRRSGATTPITSDDGSSQSKGKERAIDQDDDGGSADQLGLLQRNESQTTLRHEHGTPRGRKLLMPEEGEEHQGQSNTSAYQAYLLSAPSLRRTMSTSSGQSFTSTGGSPVPAHARTPSRTKRRSVGSTFSERLLPVDEEHHLPTPDFLALLATPPAPPLSTAEDVALLDSLTTLGFDAGQIRHSITTNACDSAAAVWWMLKRKADDRERDRIEAETLGGGTPVGTTSKTHSRQSSIRRRPSTYSQKTPEKEIYEEEEEEGSAPTRPMTRSPVPEEGLAIKGAFDPEDGNEERSAVPVTPGGRPRRAGDDECLPFFLHQPTAGTMSAPNLDFFPLIDPGSPSRKPMPRSKSKDYLSLSPSPSPSQLPPPVPSPPESPESKSKRARSGSVNMLVRATAALGSGLQLKKSTDGVKDEDDSVRSSSPSGGLFRRKSSIPDEPLLKDRPLSAPSSPPQPQSSPLKQDATKTPSRSPAPAPPPPLPPLLDPSPPMSHSGSHDTFDTVTSSTSSAAVPRPASIRRSNIPSASNTPGSSGKKSSKGANLFSNFRHWFGDGPRKRNNSKRNSSSGAASVSEGPPLARSSSLSRRNNLRQEISPSAFVGSPLKRPPLGSRRSSNGSIVGGVGAPISRRGSINSIHRPKLSTEGTPGGSAGGYHHRRRYSDASRASEPDRENLSRPGSLRSFSGQHRSNRSSSHGTGHHPSSVSPKDVIRRPPTTTVVRRRHGSHGRHGSHSRNRSTSSANTRHSSSSEQGEEEILTLLAEDEDEVAGTGGQAAILEEDENAALETTPTLEGTESDAEGERKEQERERALRTLSGDWSAIAPRVDDQGTHKTTSDAHVPHKSHSRLSLDSATSSRSHHSTTFTAHKTVHLFGAPSQPAPSSISRHKTSLSLSRPALRDVFANKEEDDNGWEDDNGDGYGGGLGQESTRSGAGASAGAGSFESSMPAMGGGAGDSPVASKLFDGRYGGRGPNEAIGGRVGVGAPNAGAGRMAVAIVEEEEEEEE